MTQNAERRMRVQDGQVTDDLDARGIAASSGSACAIGRHEIPATLLAMGLEPSIAKSALRMTFRKPLTREQVERISLAIEESYTDLTRH